LHSEQRVRARTYRWGRFRFLALILGCIATGFGAWRSCTDSPVKTPTHKPLPSQTVISNNRIAELGLIPDLDGMAVVYPEELAGLVAPDGSFRTEEPHDLGWGARPRPVL